MENINGLNPSMSSSIIGGTGNTITKTSRGAIIGGDSNEISLLGGSPEDSVIIGGSGNTISHNRSVILGGKNISSTTDDTVYVPNLEVKNNLVVDGDSTLNTIKRTTYTFTTTDATPYVVNWLIGGIVYGRYIKAIVIGNSNVGSLGGEFVKFYDYNDFGAGTTQLSSTGTLAENIAGGTPTFSINDIEEFTATGVAGITIDWKVILEYSDI